MRKINIILLIVLVAVVVSTIIYVMNRADSASSSYSAAHTYPFYRSTKYVTSNIRTGPGEEYPIVWVYKDKYIPFKVVASYNNWYQIEDYTKKTGWIFKNITSTVKSAVVTTTTAVFNKPDLQSNRIATIDAEVIVIVHATHGDYAQISLNIDQMKIKGWVVKRNLWGL